MNNRNLIILGIVSVLLIVWAACQSHFSNKPRVERKSDRYLIQGLDPDDINSIIIEKDDNILTLERNDNGFVVKESNGYPAVSKQINTLITDCLDMRTSELYTDNPDNFKDLGVTEGDAQILVKFLKSDGNLLTGIIIGKNKEQENGTFVKLITSNNVYVTPGVPYINSTADNYLNQEILSLISDNISFVTVENADRNYTLKRDAEGKIAVIGDIPAEKEFKDGEIDTVFTALSNLRFKDVKKEESSDGLNFDKKYICMLKDTTKYTIKIAEKDDSTFITCSAEFTDKSPIVKEKGTESEEELKKKEVKLIANDDAETFKAMHKGWVYEMQKDNADNLIKELAALLIDKTNDETPEKRIGSRQVN